MPVNAFDNTVLSSETPAEEESVEEIIDTLSTEESQNVLEDLEEVMVLPEMSPFLTYLSVGSPSLLERRQCERSFWSTFRRHRRNRPPCMHPLWCVPRCLISSRTM